MYSFLYRVRSLVFILNNCPVFEFTTVRWGAYCCTYVHRECIFQVKDLWELYKDKKERDYYLTNIKEHRKAKETFTR